MEIGSGVDFERASGLAARSGNQAREGGTNETRSWIKGREKTSRKLGPYWKQSDREGG